MDATKTPFDARIETADAVAALRALLAALPIDDAIPTREMAATKVTTRVPLEAIALAAAVLREAPAEFPQLDAADVEAGLAYEQAMRAVAKAAQTLADRAAKSALKRRATLARQTLALYQLMKGAARLSGRGGTALRVKQMGELLTTRRRTRDLQVTQAETDAMVKQHRSAKRGAVAKAKADAAQREAAMAAARAAIDEAVAAGTVPLVVVPGSAQARVATPIPTVPEPAMIR